MYEFFFDNLIPSLVCAVSGMMVFEIVGLFRETRDDYLSRRK